MKLFFFPSLHFLLPPFKKEKGSTLSSFRPSFASPLLFSSQGEKRRPFRARSRRKATTRRAGSRQREPRRRKKNERKKSASSSPLPNTLSFSSSPALPVSSLPCSFSRSSHDGRLHLVPLSSLVRSKRQEKRKREKQSPNFLLPKMAVNAPPRRRPRLLSFFLLLLLVLSSPFAALAEDGADGASPAPSPAAAAPTVAAPDLPPAPIPLPREALAGLSDAAC